MNKVDDSFQLTNNNVIKSEKINKTSSCVFLQHPPSNTEVKVQRERSRELNRFLAREELCDRLEKQQTPFTSLQNVIHVKYCDSDSGTRIFFEMQ